MGRNIDIFLKNSNVTQEREDEKMKKLMCVAFGIPQLMTPEERKKADGFLEVLKEVFGDLYEIEECYPVAVKGRSWEWWDKGEGPADVFVGVFTSSPPERIQFELQRPPGSGSSVKAVILRGWNMTQRPLDISNVCIGIDSIERDYHFEDWISYDPEIGACYVNEFLNRQGLPSVQQ